jgi:predicted AlkP superfamily pyrophosphatase or phosphodiesterase
MFCGVLVLIALISSAGFGQKAISDLKPTVILISLDGFRYDYVDKYHPPAMSALAEQGVRAKWMVPSFPTKTYPNHYTIVTGLYPEHHGIVENHVYDFGEVFDIGDKQKVREPKWWLGKPIWVTAEKQGQHAASYNWVGSETEIGGIWPSFWQRYNAYVPNDLRVDTVLRLLDQPVDKRPTFAALYFSESDDAGHAFGPDSEEIKYAVQDLDRSIERLVDGLKIRGIDDKVNVIIVSDHGMAPVYLRQAVFLDDLFDFGLAEQMLWTNEIAQIFPKQGKLDEIYSRLKGVQHTTCWKKDEVPARLHYRDGKRVAPIVCSSEEGWITTSHKRFNDQYGGLDDLERPRGGHGYDNKYMSMMATFIAHGPAFKRSFVAQPFENVEVYNIMCKILGLKPFPNDGDLDHVKAILK